MKKLLFGILCLCTIVVAGTLSSCNKADEPVGTFTLDQDVCLVRDYGLNATVGFTAVNIVEVSVSEVSFPGRWSATADLASRTVLVVAPTKPTTDEEEYDTDLEGTITLVALDANGFSHTAKLYVAIGGSYDFTEDPSNCYIANHANALYAFDGTRKGERGETIPTDKVEVLWTSSQYLIQYLTFEQGVVSFFVSGDEHGKLIEGNALFAAYDADGDIIWTWHLWVTDYDPSKESVTSGSGAVFMTRNLGAGASAGTTQEQILASYGLYYQWGRPTPLIGPEYYNCASEADHVMYSYSGRRTYLEYLENTPEIGTIEFAIANPMSFILGAETSGYDWLYTSGNNELWGPEKTDYDPCPRGWKVPDQDAFADFSIADEHTAEMTESLREAYGWNLTDGTISSFFHAGGRRSALLGGIQNLNDNENPQPWSGFYWTSEASANDRNASALYFDLDTDDASHSELNPAAAYPRANGFNIRCVRE